MAGNACIEASKTHVNAGSDDTVGKSGKVIGKECLGQRSVGQRWDQEQLQDFDDSVECTTYYGRIIPF